jgi:tetratricopeptide repeat protein
MRSGARGASSALRRKSGWATVVLVLGLSACAPGATVSRVMHGRTVEGSEVSEEAYAAYARGAYLEAQGQHAAAIQAYRAALDADANNAAIWTRLGALECREHPGEAESAFDEAVGLDAGYAPAWSARAACRYSRAELDAALADAERAVRLDPGDSAANLLVASILQAQKRFAEARAWLLALVLLRPEPNAHWAALSSLGAASHDPALSEYAATELARRAPGRSTPGLSERAADGLLALSSSLAAALRGGDLAEVRALAASERIDARSLALIAAASGYPALAERQAALVLDADPTDPDGLIAALAAAQSSGAGERFVSLLQRAGAERRPTALGARVLGDLLRWLSGDDAARLWLEAYEQAPTPLP